MSDNLHRLAAEAKAQRNAKARAQIAVSFGQSPLLALMFENRSHALTHKSQDFLESSSATDAPAETSAKGLGAMANHDSPTRFANTKEMLDDTK